MSSFRLQLIPLSQAYIVEVMLFGCLYNCILFFDYLKRKLEDHFWMSWTGGPCLELFIIRNFFWLIRAQKQWWASQHLGLKFLDCLL